VSYAQRGEDMILYRALKQVDNGFYIDVGAEDPDNGTVTRLFYEIGWSGINIEPTDHWFSRLVARRGRDKNICAAAWNSDGSIVLHEVTGTGLTSCRKDFAEKATRDYGWANRQITVPSIRLDSLELPKLIHFLKVDVEGAEKQVLEGINLLIYRPWIILVEATEPNSDIPTHEEWESIITSQGYAFVLFDGLNRYYIANEHLNLKPALLGE
jgi:FkbM family methyltransferase